MPAPRPTNYVLGFAFAFATAEDLTEFIPTFLLIEKKTPAWQAGYLNGIGGKIEPHESCPFAAMVREFEEECGIKTGSDGWEQMIRFLLPTGGVCYGFRSLLDWDVLASATSTTDEIVRQTRANELEFLRHRMLPNVPWLIELARAIEPDRGMMCVEYKPHGEG